jgi:hypothetical protein
LDNLHVESAGHFVASNCKDDPAEGASLNMIDGIRNGRLARQHSRAHESLAEFADTNQSVIRCEVFAQAVNPEAGIADLDFQEQLCCSQLVVKVKGCRSVCTANKLKISIDLSAFFLQRLELGRLNQAAGAADASRVQV